MSASYRDLEEDDILQRIDIAQEQKRLYIEMGALIKAEMVKEHLNSLKEQLQALRDEKVKVRQFDEMVHLEQEHSDKFQDFNDAWDQKMAEFSEQAQALEQQALERHEDEMRALIIRVDASLPSRPKDSPDLLNLKRIEQHLIKQNQFIEAHRIQQKIKELENEEQYKWVSRRNNKILSQKLVLDKKQDQELENLRKRINTLQDEQQKARTIELARLVKNYKNLKQEFTIRHRSNISKMQSNKMMSSTDGFGRSTVDFKKMKTSFEGGWSHV